MQQPPSLADDPLAQPTRARLYALLTELDGGATTAELAARLNLHPNGVRVHLRMLEQAGLLTKRVTRHGQGRPRDEWHVPPSARVAGEPPNGYHDLAVWLAGSTSDRSGSLRKVEASGRELGRKLARAEAGAAAAADFESTLALMGFRPERRTRRGGGAVICLGNCPYRDAVRANAEVVCTLHRGITRGMLAELAPGVELTGFKPKDPDRAGCLIELDG